MVIKAVKGRDGVGVEGAGILLADMLQFSEFFFFFFFGVILFIDDESQISLFSSPSLSLPL